MPKYRRLIMDLRERGQQAVEEGNHNDKFDLLLCGLKMTEAADEFEKLLDFLDRVMDDGKWQ